MDKVLNKFTVDSEEFKVYCFGSCWVKKGKKAKRKLST